MLRCTHFRHLILLPAFLLLCQFPLHAGQAASEAAKPAENATAAGSGAAGPPPVLTIPPRPLAPFAPDASFTSRVLTEDTLWKGAILVEGMVTVAPQATLTIAPGTVVRFGADSGLLVLGRIVVKGTADSTIILTSQYREPRPADWFGIVITASSKKNLLEHSVVHGAETAIQARSSTVDLRNLRIDGSLVAVNLVDSLVSLRKSVISGCPTGISGVKSEIDLESTLLEEGKTGLSLKSSSLTAERLKISSFSAAGLVADKAHLKIDRSLFSGNFAGAKIAASEGSISGSKFTGNTDTALAVAGSLLRVSGTIVNGSRVGVQVEDNLPSLWGNSIAGNNGYNILYLGDEKLYAGGNWFGKAGGEAFTRSLFSRLPDALQVFPLLAADPLGDSFQDY